jgi:heme-degrading monooxygenase HmoA
MPFISPEDGYLTVINLFRTDEPAKQDRLLTEMRAIVDVAAFPGWISSTVHSGQQRLGTANFIQWRGHMDLEARYAGDEFKHRTMPVFLDITTSARLLQTEVELAQRHPALGDVTVISPDRDDYTVLEVIDVRPADQKALIDTLGSAHDWLLDVPGYRSQSVLRGVRARGPAGGVGGNLKALGEDNSFVVVYSQWESKAACDAYRGTPEAEQPAARRRATARRDSLTVALEWNTYRVVHTRAALDPARA